MYSCIDCKYPLSQKKHGHNIWYLCSNCRSSLVSLNSFKEVLSEFEFNKVTFEINKGQIVSNQNCPCCRNRMIKVIDLVRINHVEVCQSCQMVWLNPGEGAKIKLDQNTENAVERKVNINLQGEIHPSLESALQGNTSMQGFVFNQIFLGLIKVLMLEEFSKRHPIAGFFLMVLMMIIATLIFWKFGRWLTYLGFFKAAIH